MTVGAHDLDALQTSTTECAPYDAGQQRRIARDDGCARARVRARIDDRDDLGAGGA